MESVLLSELGKIRGNKRYVVECEILDQKGPKIFKIKDASTEIDMELKFENPNHIPALEIGKKLKVINPEYLKKEKKLMITQKTGVFQVGVGKPRVSEADSTTSGYCGYETLESILEADQKTVLKGKFALKIMEKKHLRKMDTKYGPAKILPVIVKDINGCKTTLSIWPSHKSPESVMEDIVYIISGVMTDGYPYDKPHFLRSKKYFKMEKASDDLQNKFAEIKLVDGLIKGHLWGAQKAKAFPSCPFCYCSIDRENLPGECEVCKKHVEKERDDFHFLLVVEDNKEVEHKIVCFKRALPIEIEAVTSDEIEVELNQKMFGLEATVTFLTKRGKEKIEDDMIVHSLTL